MGSYFHILWQRINNMILYTERPNIIRKAPVSPMLNLYNNLKMHFYTTTNLSQNTGFRPNKILCSLKLLVVGLKHTIVFSGLQTYESVNLQKCSAYLNQNYPACFKL